MTRFKQNTLTKRLLSHALGATLVPTLLFMIGCGRQDKIYQDPAPAAVVSIDNSPLTLPQGFYNQSVNLALAELVHDSLSATSTSLQLRTMEGASTDGAFNSAGAGSRALLGLPAYHGKSLDDVAEIVIDSKRIEGFEELNVLLTIDPLCDGTSSHVIVSPIGAIEVGSLQAHDFVRRVLRLDDARWSASAGEIVDPNDNTIRLLPGKADHELESLDAYRTAYPTACLVNTQTQDPSLPKSIPTASVLFSIGNAETTSANKVLIKRISIGTVVFEGQE